LTRLNLLLYSVAGVVLLSILVYFVLQYYQRPDYSLQIDAMREDQSLFTNSRIILTNAGKQPVTNVVIFYDIKNETIHTINPGDKISLSPPEGSNLTHQDARNDGLLNIRSSPILVERLQAGNSSNASHSMS
jgi:hypothetical protein